MSTSQRTEVKRRSFAPGAPVAAGWGGPGWSARGLLRPSWRRERVECAYSRHRAPRTGRVRPGGARVAVPVATRRFGLCLHGTSLPRRSTVLPAAQVEADARAGAAGSDVEVCAGGARLDPVQGVFLGCGAGTRVVFQRRGRWSARAAPPVSGPAEPDGPDGAREGRGDPLPPPPLAKAAGGAGVARTPTALHPAAGAVLWVRGGGGRGAVAAAPACRRVQRPARRHGGAGVLRRQAAWQALAVAVEPGPLPQERTGPPRRSRLARASAPRTRR